MPASGIGEPGLPAAGADDPVLDAGPLRDGEDERPRHLRRRRQAAGRLVAEGRTCGARLGLRGAAEQDPPLDPGLVVDDVARPAVADDQLEIGETFEHRPGKARPLLGDDDDLVVGELIDEALRRDRLAIDGDLRVVGQRCPVAVLQGNPDVVVEDGDLRHS